MPRIHIPVLLMILLLPCLGFAQSDPGTEDPLTLLLEWRNAPPPAIELNDPWDVAVNADHEIFVVDRGEQRIVKYLSDGTHLLEWHGEGASPPLYVDAQCLGIDRSTGEIYVGDYDRILVCDEQGGFIRQWTLPGAANGPTAVGLDVDDAGDVFVLIDFDSYDPLVFRFTSAGVVVTSWGGTPYDFEGPADVAVDSQGRVYVAETYARRVQIFDSTGTSLGSWDDRGPWELNDVQALAIDDQDNVFVGDDRGVTKIDSNGTVLSRTEMDWPMGMDVYGNGTLYSTSTMGHREIGKWGYAPAILSITDVPDDQGRWVRLKWSASELDRLSPPGVVSNYGVYRRLDASAKALPQLRYPSPDTLAKGLEGWDVIATIPARGDSTYQLVAPTLADSTGTGGIDWSVFVISAFADGVYWDSPPDSGYSVDNLPPPIPSAPAVSENFGAYELELSWQASTAPDLGLYAVYRGASSDFIPASPQASYATTLSPQFTDDAVAAGDVWYYRLAVFDNAGNFSGYSAAEGAQVVTGAPTPQRNAMSLEQNVPNPFNPSTEIRFSVDRDGQRVVLDIYRLDGSRVRRLVDSVYDAGPQIVQWDGRDGSGKPVASGTYFYRLKAGDFMQTKRMVMVR